ncbi:MAG TPA: carboxymuconolactone decarboxylase family protein [Candidatus Dormibacteraeota bacterium]|jgi:hypothetical protein
MGTQVAEPESKLRAVAAGDLSAVDALSRMCEGNLEASGLDTPTYQLVRIAALTAMGAPPVSWLSNLGLASETGIPPERVLGTVIAIAPLVGSVRTVAASANIIRALGFAEEIGEEADDLES